MVGTEATEDEEPKQEKKKFFFRALWAAEMQDDGGADGTQTGEAGDDISSTSSMLEVQDPEPVDGVGTHRDGVVSKTRAKVKHSNVSEL